MQTLRRGMRPRPLHGQTAPIFLQEPSSPPQLAFLQIPLLLATKTLFSLFPSNSRRSMANIFLQAARLSYKTAQAAHTPGAAPAACLCYNWFGFPSGLKPDRPEYCISLGHSRHNVRLRRAARAGGWAQMPQAAPLREHRHPFALIAPQPRCDSPFSSYEGKPFLVLLNASPPPGMRMLCWPGGWSHGDSSAGCRGSRGWETCGDLWVFGLTEEGSPGGTFRTFLGCPSV